MGLRKELINLKSGRAKPGHNPKGWSSWRDPNIYPKTYTLICCDCALTHQYQFRFRILKNGNLEFKYRVRRANGYTQAIRQRQVCDGSKDATIKKGVLTLKIRSPLRRK